MYRYFDGKESLLTALQVRAIRVFEAHLVERMRVERGPLEQIDAGARAWRTFAEAQPSLFTLLDASLSDPSPNLSTPSAQAVDNALRPVLGRLEAAFTQAVEQGLLREGSPDLRTRVLWATVHGAAHFRKRDRLGGPRSDHVAHEAIATLLRGWGADLASSSPLDRERRSDEST